jgi:hypothetical protein
MLVIIHVLLIDHLKPEVKIIFKNAVPTSQTTQNVLMVFCEITNYCENQIKQKIYV